jgi:glycosyltransferase involved in cell wall biosynthesis
MPGKVCVITTVHNPFDTRIFHKEAKTLAKAGYEVVLIAQHDKNEVVDSISIIALPKPKNRVFRILFLGWKAYKIALKQNADVYHFHDPEFIFFGILLKLYGKKVIYDVHEDVAKQILYKSWIGNRLLRKIISKIFSFFEKIYSIFFSYIITATEGIAEKFLIEKTIVIRNVPSLELIDEIKPKNYKKEKKIIIYAGGLTRVRGIKEVIKAMEYMDTDYELALIGKWQSIGFKMECERLRGWEKTKYLGFLQLEKVLCYMKTADLGICLLFPEENYITGLPVKAFEYMACSLPIIMSEFYKDSNIFNECALFARHDDPKDIGTKMKYILQDKVIRLKLGKLGRALVEKEYNWEKEKIKLLQTYQKLNYIK